MHLTILPDDGAAPILSAIASATRTIDIAIFRLDMKAVVTALQAAVARGVAVRALIAHTNKGGEKALRKLEMRLLDAGVSVSRSADAFVKSHGKMMIVDGRRLHVNAFNFTRRDVDVSRSFGVVTTDRRAVREAARLFQADVDRQPYVPEAESLVVSPETSRTRLAAFLQGAKRQLLIYDAHLSDPKMTRLIAARAAAGVDVRIIGKTPNASPVQARRYPGTRMHVRAIIRDGRQAFVGSQSLRALELDHRREVGLVFSDRRIVSKLVEVFERDWQATEAGDTPAVVEHVAIALGAHAAVEATAASEPQLVTA